MEDCDLKKIPALVAELQAPFGEAHSSVAVSDESGWTIIGFQGGLVVLENVEEGEDDYGGPRHMDHVSAEELGRLMRLVAVGELARIEELDWVPGYQ